MSLLIAEFDIKPLVVRCQPNALREGGIKSFNCLYTSMGPSSMHQESATVSMQLQLACKRRERRNHDSLPALNVLNRASTLCK